MSQALVATLCLCSVYFTTSAQSPGNAEKIGSPEAVIHYTGKANSLLVSSTNTAYVECKICVTDSIVAIDGRKWQRLTDSTVNRNSAATSTTNVGINTPDPAYTLDVNGDINATGNILLNGTPITATEPFAEQADTSSFIISNTSAKYIRVRIDPFVPVTSMTITMPSNPFNGQRLCVIAGGHLSAPSAKVVGILSIQPNNGQEVIGRQIFYSVEVDDQALCWEFNGSNNKWYVIR